MATAVMDRRSGESVTWRTFESLNAPKKNAPPAVPMPHPTQKAIPTGAMVEPNHHFGRTGFGPSWLVFWGGGGGVEQVSFGPHPSLAPFPMRFSSSLHSGPFSVSHRLLVSGSKLKPKE